MPGSDPSRWLVRNLLWLDGGAGLAVGALGLLLNRFLADLYKLPDSLLFAMSAANLLYASYSLTLASRKRRPMPMILILIAANAAWGCFCVYLLFRHWPAPSAFGVAQLALEAIFVAGLAALEWHYRHSLAAS